MKSIQSLNADNNKTIWCSIYFNIIGGDLCTNATNTYVDILEIDIVSESVRPELKLASSESRRETGL